MAKRMCARMVMDRRLGIGGADPLCYENASTAAR